MWDGRKQLVRGWKKRYTPVDTGVGQASMEVLDEKVAMIKYHPTSTSRMKHVIKLRSVWLDCHSSEIQVLEKDVVGESVGWWGRIGGIEQLKTGRIAFCE